MTDYVYEAPTDKVIGLLNDAEIDNRTQEQIIEGFKDVNKVVFKYEIVPCHLKLKSKIFRMKKSITVLDKLSLNRTYLHRDDYEALHERVIKEQVQKSTAKTIATRIANFTESLDSDIYVHDNIYRLDKDKYIYILSVEIRCNSMHPKIYFSGTKNIELHNFIGDVIQHTVFNVNVLLDRALMVKPVIV